MKKVLITGASGFVGTNLSKFLSNTNSYEIIEVGRNSQGKYPVLTETKCDIVIHLAGKAHDLKKVSKPEDYYEANFELTKQIYNFFLSSDAQTFIFLSSVKAVADEVKGVLDENTIPDPKTHYGKSKLLAENYLKQNLKEGKRVFILRPCIIHGEGNKGNLSLLYSFVKKGVPYFLGAFDNRRSFLTIDNLCFSIKELIENENIASDTFNLADNESISTNNLISIMSSSLEKKSLIWKLNPSFIKLLAKLGDYFKLPLNTERLNKLTENYVVSNQKLCNVIGKELPYSTEAGLLKTFKFFK